jgi:hypothetical protein
MATIITTTITGMTKGTTMGMGTGMGIITATMHCMRMPPASRPRA